MQKNTLLILQTIVAAAAAKYMSAFAIGKEVTVADLIADIKSAIWREITSDTAIADGSDFENILCGLVPQTSPQSVKVAEYVHSLKGMDKNIAKIILGVCLLDGDHYIPVDFNIVKEMEEFKDSFISELVKKLNKQ